MHYCPFNGCGQVVSDDRFCCRVHWFKLSNEQQDQIWRADRMYQAGGIGIQELRAEQQAVMDAVQPRSLF